MFHRLNQTPTVALARAAPCDRRKLNQAKQSTNQGAKCAASTNQKARSSVAAVSGRVLYRLLSLHAHTSTLDTEREGSSVSLSDKSSACVCASGTISRSSSLPDNMTFTEMCNACDSHCEKSSPTIGQALEKCLSRAVATQRVTVGVQECAKLLGCAPERVMLCLIPDMAGSPDVGMHIQHTLVRSFCWENDIRLLMVKDTDKLQHFFDFARAASGDEAETTESQPAASCVLIEVPKEDLSPDEEFVCNYHDTVIYSDIYPKPIIQLPV